MDSDRNSDASVAERGQVDQWVFLFKYESPSCGGPEPSAFSTISYNSATYRSGFWQSDFALVELDQRPQNGEPFTYAGWSRSTTAATSGVAIHHPQGDVKKISVEQNALTNVAVATNWGLIVGGLPLLHPANTHWQAIFETGTVEHGSSGSPIFNQNSQIVGQLHGDFTNTDNNYCGSRRGHYGRFDVSWNGGGTNDTRLSNWLDPTGTGATTLAQMAMPSISGPALLCTTGTYTLTNVPAGVPVSWSVSTPSGVSPTSGSGTVANLTRINAEDVTITFTIGCNGGGTVSRRILVGPPQFGGFLVNGQSTSNGTGCTNSYIPIAAVPNDPSASYYWSQSDPNGFIANASQSSTAFTAYNANCYYLNVNIYNSCGSTNQTLTICTNNCLAKYTVYPNPAKDYITVEFDQIESAEFLPDEIVLLSEKSTKSVKNVDVQALYQRNGLKNGKQVEIDAKALPRGTYYLHIKNSRLKETKVDIVRILLE